ncbi:MAG: DUF11 domain-containing protein [Clostridia bacterium]|nr:DUF11 domain-containing protein [Clostridia bacterium]
MNKYKIKWLGLIVSVAVFIGCACYLSFRTPVSALESKAAASDSDAKNSVGVTVGTIVAGDIEAETGSTGSGTVTDPYVASSSSGDIDLVKSTYKNTKGEYVIDYNLKGENLLADSDNYILVDLSSDNAEHVISTLCAYVQYINTYSKDSALTVKALGDDSEVTVALPYTAPDGDPDAPATAEAAVGDYLRDVLANDDPDAPTDAELAAAVEAADTALAASAKADKNIIVVAVHTDTVSSADCDADLYTAAIDTTKTTAEDVVADLGNAKLMALNIAENPTRFTLTDNINSPYVLLADSDKATLSTNNGSPSTASTSAKDDSSGKISATYSIPPICVFDGTFEYAIVPDEDPEITSASDDTSFEATDGLTVSNTDADNVISSTPTIIDTEIPVITLDKTAVAPAAGVTASDVINYKIVLKNTGNVALTNVSLTDTIICSDCVTASDILATTGTGSATKTYTFKKVGTNSSTGIMEAPGLTLQPGQELTVTYKFTVPAKKADCSGLATSTVSGTTVHSIVNIARATCDETNPVEDNTSTLFKVSPAADPETPINPSSSGNASGNGSSDSEKDPNPESKGDGDSSGDSKDESPETGDSAPILAAVIMVIAFIGSAVSLFLIINEKKVRKLLMQANS